MSASVFWYDFETTGINPRCDRPLQVAGIRTDEALNEIGEPLNLYCRLSEDILPHPAACLVTGITPQRLAERGVSEAQFMGRLHAELSQPQTCTAGYNNLRFDDEVTRYSLYRNFYDPYAREWQGGNSRFDLIDAMRCAYALRPHGINWPQADGQVSLKLERLTEANGIEHGNAHDALSDVRATIALARLLREKQPRLYDYLYRLRSKHEVSKQISLLTPLVHISGRFSAQRHFLSVILPLAWHPTNRNALIVCDLQLCPSPLLDLEPQVLRERLYTRREALAEGQLPVPLKLLHINRCPVVAPLSVLQAEDQERLGLDFARYRAHTEQLRATQALWQSKLAQLYASEDFLPVEDPEQQLYQGFIGEGDRRACDRVREADGADLAGLQSAFKDARLAPLLFRYRARNYPQSLSSEETAQWQAFCLKRLTDPAAGAPLTYSGFIQALSAYDQSLPLLDDWRVYAEALWQRLSG